MNIATKLEYSDAVLYTSTVFFRYCLQIKLLNTIITLKNVWQRLSPKTAKGTSNTHSLQLFNHSCKLQALFQSSSMEILHWLILSGKYSNREQKRRSSAELNCVHVWWMRISSSQTHMLHSSTNTSDTPLSISVHVCVSQWHITWCTLSEERYSSGTKLLSLGRT